MLWRTATPEGAKLALAVMQEAGHVLSEPLGCVVIFSSKGWVQISGVLGCQPQVPSYTPSRTEVRPCPCPITVSVASEEEAARTRKVSCSHRVIENVLSQA